MTTKTCDRCGAEITTVPWSNAVLPAFYIHKLAVFSIGWQTVDLCPDCEKKLSDWLSNGKGEQAVG